MKKFLFLILLFTAISVAAQKGQTQSDFLLNWGNEFEIPNKESDLGLMYYGDGAFVNVSQEEGKGLVMRTFDQNQNLSGVTDLIFEQIIPPDHYYDQLYKVGDSWYIFYGRTEKNSKVTELFAKPINLNDGHSTGAPVKLFEAEKIALGSMYSTWIRYQYFTSADRELTMIRYKKLASERDNDVNRDQYGFYVFDSSLRNLWGREMAMPYTEDMMELKNYIIDSNGNLVLTVKVFDETKKEAKDPRRNYHYELLVSDKARDTFSKINVTIDGRYVNNLLVRENNSGGLIAAGFYSNTAGSNICSGAFVGTVDLSVKESAAFKPKLYEFNGEILAEFEAVKASRKSKGRPEIRKSEESNLRLKGLTFHSDGGVTLTGEEWYQFYPTNYLADVFQNIITLRTAGDGSLTWMKNIPKRQDGLSEYSASFKVWSTDDNDYFIYRDNAINMELTPGKSPYVQETNPAKLLVYTRIKSSGEMSKSIILGDKESDFFVTPVDFKVSTNGRLLIATKKKSKRKLLCLTIRDQH